MLWKIEMSWTTEKTFKLAEEKMAHTIAELGAPTNRISHREVFYEKRILKSFPKLTGKILP